MKTIKTLEKEQDGINLLLIGLILVMPLMYGFMPIWGKIGVILTGLGSIILAGIKLKSINQKS